MGNRIWSKFQEAIFAWAAATASDRTLNLIIQAFAGTGKTTTMVELVNRAPEESILCCAFARKNKLDLEAKLTRSGAEARTFNSLGLACCVRYMGLSYQRKDQIMNSGRAEKLAQAVCGVAAPKDMVKLVAKLASKGKHTLPGWEKRAKLEVRAASETNAAKLVELRAAWKDAPQVDMEALAYEHDLQPDEEWAADGWDTAKVAKLALAAMHLAATAHTLPRDNAHFDCSVDGDDQCYLPVVNKWVSPRYDMVVVDECQDTDACQLKLARGLLRDGGRFVVVGDRFQAIYRFRGADAGSMDKLKAEMSKPGKGGIVELTLPETYRCGKAIVAEAAKLVPGYVAHEGNAAGEVRTAQYGELAKLAEPGDFILSRANAPLASACLKLWKAGKRAKVEGRAMGEGLLALIGKLKAKSIPDFLTKLAKWEERESDRARKGAKDEDAAQAKVDVVVDKADCLRTLADGVTGLPELTDRINNLFADVLKRGDDAVEVASPPVVLMTVHKAKGLETDRVFILEDTFKVKKSSARAATSSNAKDKAQDELFIRYVAVTRAKTQLTYVHGLEDGGGAKASVPTAHEAAVTAAAGEAATTLESIAQAIENLKQLSEKNPSAEYLQAIAQLEEKQRNMTQAKA